MQDTLLGTSAEATGKVEFSAAREIRTWSNYTGTGNVKAQYNTHITSCILPIFWKLAGLTSV